MRSSGTGVSSPQRRGFNFVYHRGAVEDADCAKVPLPALELEDVGESDISPMLGPDTFLAEFVNIVLPSGLDYSVLQGLRKR